MYLKKNSKRFYISWYILMLSYWHSKDFHISLMLFVMIGARNNQSSWTTMFTWLSNQGVIARKSIMAELGIEPGNSNTHSFKKPYIRTNTIFEYPCDAKQSLPNTTGRAKHNGPLQIPKVQNDGSDPRPFLTIRVQHLHSSFSRSSGRSGPRPYILYILQRTSTLLNQ